MRDYYTKKKTSYYREVIRLRFSGGYSIRRISEVFPVSANTVSRWIRIFEAENKKRNYAMKKKQPAMLTGVRFPRGSVGKSRS